jgi:hypothetical protein
MPGDAEARRRHGVEHPACSGIADLKPKKAIPRCKRERVLSVDRERPDARKPTWFERSHPADDLPRALGVGLVEVLVSRAAEKHVPSARTYNRVMWSPPSGDGSKDPARGRCEDVSRSPDVFSPVGMKMSRPS